MFTTKPFQLISSCQLCLNRPLWSKYSLWASQSLLLIAASQLQSPLLQMICLCQHCLAKKTLWSDHNLIPQIETNRGVSLVSTSFCNQSKITFYLPVSIVCPWSFDPIGQIEQIKASHWSMSFFHFQPFFFYPYWTQTIVLGWDLLFCLQIDCCWNCLNRQCQDRFEWLRQTSCLGFDPGKTLKNDSRSEHRASHLRSGQPNWD